MCLAVPGRITAISANQADPVTGRLGTVDFQGNRVEASLAMVPQAKVGDWVLVHAGFAITLLEEAEARETWEYLDSLGLAGLPEELRTGASPSGKTAP